MTSLLDFMGEVASAPRDHSVFTLPGMDTLSPKILKILITLCTQRGKWHLHGSSPYKRRDLGVLWKRQSWDLQAATSGEDQHTSRTSFPLDLI